MRRVFIDSHFFIARLYPRDQWHTAARAAEASLGQPVRFVTTHEVLTEFLAGVADIGPFIRQQAGNMVLQIKNDPTVTVLPPSLELFEKGLARYLRRLDKEYSLTDCISMVVMEEEGITEVLTNDHHFEQEGFQILIQR